MDLDKLKKDRKLLRGIDRNAATRSTLVSFAHVMVYVLVCWWGTLATLKPGVTITLGILLVAPSIWRTVRVIRFDHAYGAAPTRWRHTFVLVHLLHAACYSLFCFVALFLLHDNAYGWFFLVFTLGTVLVSVEIWRPYRRVNEATTVILMGPLVLGFLLTGGVHGWVAAFSFLPIIAYILRIIKCSYDAHWQSLYHQFLSLEKSKDLETLDRKLERVGEGRIGLLSDLTHEIRTPMNSVLGLLNLLKHSGLDESQKEMVSVAQHAGNAMLTLVDDILDFSRIASGTIALVSSVFNLRRCVEDTLELLGPVAYEKGIELSAVYDRDVPVRVRGDAHRIGQILNNLVSNAIKFSDEGEVIVTVHMTRLSAEDGLLRIQVIDQGVGISAQKQDELFRAFHKADASTTRKHGGTGLGLAISKGLVEAMHGQIGLISEVDKGSTFWFTCQLMLSTQQVATMPAIKAFLGQRALIVGAPPGLSQSIKQELDSWGIESNSLNEGYDKALQRLREYARQSREYQLLIANFGHQYTGILKLVKIVSEDPVLGRTRQILLTTLEQRSIPAVKATVTRSENVVLVTKPLQRRQFYKALSQLYGVEPRTRVLTHSVDRADADCHPSCHQSFSVLVVEDDKVNQMVASGMLNRLGHRVKVVDNGDEAVRALQEQRFDLVIMDCHMPVMDGYAATSAIREMESGGAEHVPIIGMNADTADGEETRCLAVGMDDVMLKPVTLEELDSKLRRWLLADNLETGVGSRSPEAADPSADDE
ncbi:MAG: ATP-binding protein [Gammaproteobacteria bacterium]